MERHSAPIALESLEAAEILSAANSAKLFSRLNKRTHEWRAVVRITTFVIITRHSCCISSHIGCRQFIVSSGMSTKHALGIEGSSN